jgi:putative phosphoesterase
LRRTGEPSGERRECETIARVRIAVVSDTHLPRFGRDLPRALRDGLAEEHVGLILHLGDFTTLDVAALFEAIAPFDGVAGNNDPPGVLDRFGRRKVVTVDGVRIGLTHGDVGPGRTTPERAIGTFGREVDVILFGHSHIPLARRLTDGRWLMNPGSPTDRRREPRYSWGVVEVVAGSVTHVELRSFDDGTA